MQFYNNEFLYLLWLTGGLILLFFYWQKRRKAVLAQLINLKLLSQLAPAYRLNIFLIRGLFFILGFLFLIMALARPQWGKEQKTIQRKGVNIVFMLDTSLSMLTEDTKPSRIVKARLIVNSFLKKLKGDRVGLVVFAGSAYIATPLTVDYSAFRLFLDSASVGIVPEQGSNFKAALATALVAFPKKEKQHKAIVLLSDGEHHEGDVSSWVAKVKSEGVKIYCIGVGTKEGEPIPLRAGKGKISGYKKDRLGVMVISHLEDKVLKQIAEQTGGKYYPATPDEREVDLIYQHMQTLGKREFKEKQISMRQDRFQLFILLGLLFLFLEDLIRESQRRNKVKATAFAILLVIWISQSAFSLDPLASKSQEADTLYEQAKYEEALKTYRSEQVKHPENPELRYNVGTTLYKTKDFKEAKYQLDSAIQKIQDKNLRAKAYYNRGNTLYRLGDMEGAITSYQKALENNPNDQDAKFNLELLKKKKEAQSNQHKDDQNKQQQDQNQKQQNQDQQKQNQQQQDQQNQEQNQQNQQQNKQQGQDKKENQDQGQGSDKKQENQNQSQSQDQKQQEDKQAQQDKQQQDQKNQQDLQNQKNQQDQQQQKSDQQKQDQSKSEQNQQNQQDKQSQKSDQQKQQENEGEKDQKDQSQASQEGEKQDQSFDSAQDKQKQQDQESQDQPQQDQGQDKSEESRPDLKSEDEAKKDSSEEGDQQEEPKESQDKNEEKEQKPSETEELDLKADLTQEEEGRPQDQEGQEDQKDQEEEKEQKDQESGEEPGKESEPEVPEPAPTPSYLPTTSEPQQPGSPAPSYRPAGGLQVAGPSAEEGEEQGLVAVAASGTPRFSGDMSEQEALKILNAVNSEEKQLLVMRRPPRQREANQRILKDW